MTTEYPTHPKVGKNAFQWAIVGGFNFWDVVLDPDGWRDDDGVDLDTPISYEEFQRRLMECTVHNPRATAMSVNLNNHPYRAQWGDLNER